MDYFKSYTEIQNLSDAIGAIIEQECCVTSLEEIENVILSDFEKNSLTNLEKEINAFVRREFHDKILGMLRNFTFSTVASLAQYATSHATQSVKENVEKLISFTRTKANPDASLAKLRIIGEDNPIRERGTEHIVSDADAVTGIEQPSQRNNMSDMLSELEKQRALLVLDDLDLKARARVKVGDAISQIKGDRAHRVKTPMLCMHELKENIKRITSEINSYSATLHGELINLNFQYRFLEHDKKVLISKIIELIQRILLSRQVELLSQNKRASINLTLQADDEIALVSELTKILDKKTDTNNNAIDRILYCIRRYTGTPIDKQLHHKLFSQIELDITHYFQSLTRLQEVKMQNTENNNGAIQPFNFSNQVSQLMSSVTKEDMTAGVQGLFNGISQWSRNNQLGQEGMLLDKRKINGNQFIALKTIGGVFSCIQESQKTQQLQMVMMGNVLQGMLRNQAAWHAETIRMNKAREAFIRECEQWQQNFILEHITPLTQKVLELIVPFNEIKKLSSEDKQFLTDQGNTLKETARDLQNTLDKMRENRVALLGQGDEHIKLVEQLDKSNRLIVDALTSSISEVNKSNKGLLQEGFGTIKSVVESLMQAKAQVAPNANQLPPGQDPALQEQANNQAPAAQQAQTTSTHSPSNVHDAQLLSSASLAYGIFKRRYRNETMRETDETYAKQQEAKDAYKAILRQNLDAQTRAQVDKRLNKLKNPESLLRPSVQ